MPLETPTPDGVLELFRDEIIPREADVDGEFDEAIGATVNPAWEHPFPGVETSRSSDGPTLMRVTYKRTLAGTSDEVDRIRHELRELWNDIRAAISSDSQAEFVPPRMTHVDGPEGLEVTCYTHGIARGS